MDPSLHEAARLGDVGFLRGIKDGHVSTDLLQHTPKGNNILHIAAEFKQIEFFKDASIDEQSPLFWATNKKGDTPLHVAARVGCAEVVEFLIEHSEKMLHLEGADEESRSTDGEAHKELLRMTNLRKDTALHVASRYGRSEVVMLLMKADPELCCYTNSANESPLFLATSNGFPRIILYFLNESPICPSFQGINGVTALHAVATHETKSSKGIVKTMLSKNPEIVKEVDAIGWTPLHYAALSGNLEPTRLLMQCDSSASYILDKFGMSALHVAAYAGHTKVLEELIQCRPDTSDLLNVKGQTVLHAAVLGGRRNVVKYILNTPRLAGLINEADNDGNTALHLAAIYQNVEIIRTLASDRRVDKTAINKEFSKAVDIFVVDDGKLDLIRIQRVRGLGRSIGIPFFQQQVCHDFMMNLESPKQAGTSSTSAITENYEKLQAISSEATSKVFDTNLVVAMLIATVTFAAAFTMPGGIKTDGRAVLYGEPSFQVFLIFDTLSFLSILVVFHHFMVATVSGVLVNAPSVLIQYSIGGMLIAFASGMLAVLPQHSPVGILISLICGFICLSIIFKRRIVPVSSSSRAKTSRRWFLTRTI